MSQRSKVAVLLAVVVIPLSAWGAVVWLDRDVYLRIEAPRAAATVSGQVPLTLSYVNPVGYIGWVMAFDEAPLDVSPKGTPLHAELHTTRLSNGPHTLKVAMAARGFRRWEDSIPLVVDNPPQRLIHMSQNVAGPGDLLEAVLEFNLPGLTAKVKPFQRGPLGAGDFELTQVSAKTFKLRLAVPEGEELFTGYDVPLIVTHPNGRALTIHVPIDLERASVDKREP